MRKLDKTKKSNIKCEHCEHWDSQTEYCKVRKQKKRYYQRSKDFEWNHKYD